MGNLRGGRIGSGTLRLSTAREAGFSRGAGNLDKRGPRRRTAPRHGTCLGVLRTLAGAGSLDTKQRSIPMRPLAIIGLLLIIGGLIALAVPSITFFTNDRVADL